MPIPDPSMHGLQSLDIFDFGILLQALANNLKVGVLAIRSGDREKYLHLDRSRLLAVHTRKPKVTVEKVLWNYRAIEKVPLREALAEIERSPGKGPIERYLLEAGFVAAADLRRARYYQMTEEVLELFYWKGVGFEFYGGDNAREILSRPGMAVLGEPVDVESLLLQCTKRIDDIAKFNEVTPSLRDVYELQPGSLGTLEKTVPDRVEREFLLLIDGVRDMREVLRDMRLNRFEALEYFCKFRTRGWLRPKNAFELLMLAENRRRDFTLEKRARVLERVNELGVEGFQVLLPLAQTYEEMGAREKAAGLYAKQSLRCLDAGDMAGAAQAAKRACELEPNDTALRQAEIDVLLAAGRKPEASAALLALARLRSAAHEHEAVVRCLRRAVRLAPRDTTAWGALAEAEERAGNRRRAARCRRRHGDVARAGGKSEIAIDAYQRARVLCPSEWSVSYRLVEALHDAARGDEAVQALAELVAFVVAHKGWSSQEPRLQHLGKIEERLRAMGGFASSAAQALGRAWVEAGEPARAIAVFRESSEALSRAGRHRGAVQALDALLELDPNDHVARRAVAREHTSCGDGTRALSHLRRLAGNLLGAGRHAEARDAFEEMLRVDPACPDAHRGLARALLYLGETERAAEHYHRVGLIYRGYGRPEEAAPYLREAVERRPNDARLLGEYCELLLSMDGHRDEAGQALAALVELHMTQENPALAAIALTRLLDIDGKWPGARTILRDAARALLRMAETSEELTSEIAAKVMREARITQTG